IVLQTLGLNVAQAHIALYLIVGLLGLSVTPLILKIQETPRYSGQTRLERKGVLPRKSAKVLIRFSTYSVMIAVGAGLFGPLLANWFFHAYAVPDVVRGVVLGFVGILS